MDQPSSSMRDLARRLLNADRAAADSHTQQTLRVCGRLQISLTRFAGADGFKSLLGRALALASVDVPSLRSVKIAIDGRLEGFELLAADADSGEAAVAITSHLLELLVIFIGEPITLNLVREAWPELSLDK